MRRVSFPAAIALATLSLGLPASAQERLVAGTRSAAEAAPNDVPAQIRHGRALRRAGRYDEAANVLKRVQARGVDPAFELAEVYFDQEDHNKAEKACTMVKRHDRSGGQVGARAHLCDGFAWLAWRRESRAAEAFQKALAQQPNLARAYVGLGEGRRMLSDVEGAETNYRKALELDANAVDAHLGLVELYLATTGRAADARPHIRAALRMDPDSARARLLCARMVGRGRWATDAVQKGLVIRPAWAEARQMLGRLLLDDGKIEEAAAEFREAIRLQDNLGLAHEGLGLAHLAAGRLEEAERELRRAMQIVPNLSGAMTGIGEIQAQTSRVDEAIETLRQAADLDPRNPTPLLRAAEVVQAQGRNTIARGFLERVLAIDPQYAPAHLLLGDIYWGLEDWQRARQSYEAAIRGQVDPAGRARANERLVQLRQL